MILQDSRKEFEGNCRLGYGIDGNGDEDFDTVRGTFDANKFIVKLNSDTQQTTKKFDTLKSLLI
jgi:hypothetical protein